MAAGMLNTDGNSVLVCARLRPESSGEATCVRVTSDGTCVALDNPAVEGGSEDGSRLFGFDAVFPGKLGSTSLAAAQEELFRSVGQPLADACMAGYNVTIFAYGQTGSGKSYSMMGYQDPSGVPDTRAPEPGRGRPWDERGLAPRVLEYLFGLMASASFQQQQQKCEYTCKCTMLEIYNESIVDLLDASGTATHLQLREDFQRGVFVDGLIEETAQTWAQAYEILCRGLLLRTTGETLMNPRSSRSHCVFTIDVQAKTTEASGVMSLRHARMNLVDLAGSERQRSTSAAGVRLKEAGQINKSLTVLSSVIRSLGDVASGKERYIRYRDSKLTFLLKDSLGGNSKTCIIATLSTTVKCYAETLSTLMFAERAKLIKNKAVVNEQVAGNATQLQAELKRVKEELEAYKAAQTAQMLAHPESRRPSLASTMERRSPRDESGYFAGGRHRLSMSRRRTSLSMAFSDSYDADEVKKEFEEEITSMELVLLRMQERNQELCSDADALREQVAALQQTQSDYEQLFFQLKFMLKLRQDEIQKLIMNHEEGGNSSVSESELARLRRENTALQNLACDYETFARLRVQVYLLREAEAKRAQMPNTFQEWENRVQELTSLVSDLEKKCRDLLNRVHQKGDSGPDDMQIVEDDDDRPSMTVSDMISDMTDQKPKEASDEDVDMELESPQKRARVSVDVPSPHPGADVDVDVDANVAAVDEDLILDPLRNEIARLREQNAKLASEAEEAKKRAEQIENDFVGMGEALERCEQENAMLRKNIASVSPSSKEESSGGAGEKRGVSESDVIEQMKKDLEKSEKEQSRLSQSLHDLEIQRANERSESLKAIAQKEKEVSAKDEEIAELREAQKKLQEQLLRVEGELAAAKNASVCVSPVAPKHQTFGKSKEASRLAVNPQFTMSTQEVLRQIEALSDSDDEEE